MAAQHVDVLLVEDDRDIRDTLADLLETRGWSVAVAGDGAAALRLLDEGLCPRVLLVDQMMPVMDGGTLLRTLQSRPAAAHIPAIVLTAARIDPDARRRAVAAFRKPFDFNDLCAAIEDAFQSGRAA